MPNNPSEQFYSTHEVRCLISKRKGPDGKFVPCTYQTLRYWRRDGLLPFIKVAGQIKYPKTLIDAHFAQPPSGMEVTTMHKIEQYRTIKTKKQMHDAMRARGVDLEKIISDIEKGEAANQKQKELLEDAMAATRAKAQLEKL